jgi:fucose 4-O-acetylase-like acetyltransferase
MTNQKKVVPYDILRVITTLLVIFSHGHYHAFHTGYGGIDYSALMTGGDFAWKVLGLLIDFINSFTMPTFMALGGALFLRSMKKGKYPTFWALARDKALRLLVPFLVVTLLYSFPLKLATGYFRESESVVKDLLLGQLLVQGNTHLWYLPAMFFDFLICYLLERYVKIPRLAKLAVLGILSVAVWADSAPLLLVAYPLRFSVWFYAGYCFESVRKKLQPGMIHGIIGMVVTTAVYLFLRNVLPTGGFIGVVRLAGQKLLLPAVAAISLYSLSCGLTVLGMENTRLHGLLSRNTFGMYLYSDPINYVVLALGSTIGGVWLFGTNPGVLLLYALRIGTTLGVSILISELLRRCKVKYII